MPGCQLGACSKLCRTANGQPRDGYDWACQRLEALSVH